MLLPLAESYPATSEQVKIIYHKQYQFSNTFLYFIFPRKFMPVTLVKLPCSRLVPGSVLQHCPSAVQLAENKSKRPYEYLVEQNNKRLISTKMHILSHLKSGHTLAISSFLLGYSSLMILCYRFEEFRFGQQNRNPLLTRK